MLNLRRAVLLLLTALWLPIQTVTAFVMPLGLLGFPAQSNAAVVEGVMAATVNCHAHATSDEAVLSPVGNEDADSPADACQQCGVCHLACAGYVPSGLMARLALQNEAVLVPAAEHDPSSRATPPPHHPPRA